MRVVGISGKAGVGKDYISRNYLKPLGFYQWSLAWHFKIWLASKGTWSYNDVFYDKPPECRKDLQDEGTKRGREAFGNDIWCFVAGNWLRLIEEAWGIDRFVIADVRFPNEVEFIHRMGGKVIRIVAPERAAIAPLGPEARLHISETALDQYETFDATLRNDPGEDAEQQLRKILQVWDWDDVLYDLQELPTWKGEV